MKPANVELRRGREDVTTESGGAWRWATANGIELGTELNRYLYKLSRAMPAKKGA